VLKEKVGKQQKNEAAISHEFKAQYMKQHKYLNAKELTLRKEKLELSSVIYL